MALGRAAGFEAPATALVGMPDGMPPALVLERFDKRETTRVFPNLKHDRMALKLNGKDDNLRRPDFRTLAATAGLKAASTDAAIDDMLRRMGGGVDRITLPKAIEHTAEAGKIVTETLDICRRRIELFA